MVAAAQINAIDPNALADLKRLSRDSNSPEALRATAKQFEALFLQMVLKSMRAAVPSNSMFDSDQTRMFQALQDQQTAMNMAQGRGIGLADVIYRQLGGDTRTVAQQGQGGAEDSAGVDLSRVTRRAAIPAAALALPANSAAEADELGEFVAQLGAAMALPRAEKGTGRRGDQVVDPVVEGAPATDASGASRPVPEGAREFVNRVWAHAGEASRSTGIPAHFMVGQAALETGWGRGELRRADGSPSHNLFNIKAGANWKGAVVEVPVTEYANGRPYTETARFRAYGSYSEAFRDYANLLRGSPRYAEVLGQTDAAGFARSLQQAGYATDPMYADKLTRIIGGATLRTALAG
ncbi:flagellar assembly peptidoglycan hydrolase FlgJ [Aromatoleum diolicum]|uniref:Peptidoglycan hydrolase FlgJ n=1 Tax=Aromatoleum diolicum TaxID=75796 RepID=A0ABX1QGX2_9RHOO|nr:flagellar assembly peptidoglycan hydrolase FlgJ [Aromatoleum diolicum]NMG77553.1 flagellar assembly peptidoglycan hydrolase FlgJ [Aromatoleum diolicum]